MSRLRDYLNQQKAHAAAAIAAGQRSGSGDGDMPGDSSSEFGSDTDSPGQPGGGNGGGGGGTPVLNMNVAGSHAAGATPVIPTPTPGGGAAPSLFMQHAHFPPQQYQYHHVGGSSTNSANPAHLSQSAPASTTMNPWHHNPQPQGLGLGQQTGGQGSAQHVTGLMGAAILDEVDEGDEAFGEGSEIMDG